MTTNGTVISYPIPLYANLPIESQFYQPTRFVISDISLGPTTTVTTTTSHDYDIGQECRLIIPSSYGCRQLNEQSGFVLSIPSVIQVTLSINSIGGDSFVSSTNTTILPQILAIGDVNSGNINANGNINLNTNVPGAFINISPN